METKKVVLFDGVCNLCNSTVQTIIKRDPNDLFRFASLQSEFGQSFLKEHRLNQESFETIILLENNQVFTYSNAVLRIGLHLNGYKLLSKILLLLPQSLRDWGYRIVSKNRYKWFGKQESCWIPTPELKSKFLN